MSELFVNWESITIYDKSTCYCQSPQPLFKYRADSTPWELAAVLTEEKNTQYSKFETNKSRPYVLIFFPFFPPTYCFCSTKSNLFSPDEQLISFIQKKLCPLEWVKYCFLERQYLWYGFSYQVLLFQACFHLTQVRNTPDTKTVSTIHNDKLTHSLDSRYTLKLCQIITLGSNHLLNLATLQTPQVSKQNKKQLTFYVTYT